MSDERGQVGEATREAEAKEAPVTHEADPSALPEGGESLEDRQVDDEVRNHYREMTERGAHEAGEGRIT